MAVLGAAPAALEAQASPTHRPPAVVDRYPRIPIEYHCLSNGLKVVISHDTTMQLAVVGVYYGVGQRTESLGHEGFAHLFEHLMFEGSTHLPPGALVRLIESSGGTFNGNTRFDFTDYWEIVPTAAVRLMLWAEADRMRGLVVDSSALQRQKAIVASELRLSYLDTPDGGFPWLDVPSVANRNWQNAHNFRGLPSGLDSATLPEVRAFHAAYYVPNNAVVVVAGRVQSTEVMTWIRQYFGSIPAGPPIHRPDATESLQAEERRGERIDSLAKDPVLAVAFHMPERHSSAFAAMVVIDQLLLQDPDALLPQSVVVPHGPARSVGGGANLQGNLYNYAGPMLWTIAAQYHRLADAPLIVDSIQAVLDRVAAGHTDSTAIARARQNARVSLYAILDANAGFGRVDLLASFALFDDDPDRINHLEDAIAAVSLADVARTAQEYLSHSERTVYVRRPRLDPSAAAQSG